MNNASISATQDCTEAEGPGRRFAIWFQGCPLRCPGCCNPEMLAFRDDREVPISQLIKAIAAAKTRHDIEGITLLGGEPLAHIQNAVQLAAAAKELSLSVMVFTGYTMDEAKNLPQAGDVEKLWSLADLVVAGPYMRELPDHRRRWIGSTNQEVAFLTDRYSADDPYWRQPNTIELRLRKSGDSSAVLISGFPVKGILGKALTAGTESK